MLKLTEFTNFPTGSQINRLHRFAQDSKNEADFREKLKALRQIAQDSLKKCRTKQMTETLFSFLNSINLTGSSGQIEQLILNSESPEAKLLLEQVEYSDSELISLKNQFFKLYLTSFFTLMQKQKKQEGQHV